MDFTSIFLMQVSIYIKCWIELSNIQSWVVSRIQISYHYPMKKKPKYHFSAAYDPSTNFHSVRPETESVTPTFYLFLTHKMQKDLVRSMNYLL